MALDFLMDMAGKALDKFLHYLPGFNTDGWGITDGLRTISEYLALWWNLLPPLKTALAIIAAGMLVEVVLIAWYWINWLIKKIPGIG